MLKVVHFDLATQGNKTGKTKRNKFAQNSLKQNVQVLKAKYKITSHKEGFGFNDNNNTGHFFYLCFHNFPTT